MYIKGDYGVMLCGNMRGKTNSEQREALLMQTLARWAAPSLHCGPNGLRFTLIPSLLSIISAFTVNDQHQTNAVEQNLYLDCIMHSTGPEKQQTEEKKNIMFAFRRR